MELLIVLAVTGTLAAAAVPMYRDYTARAVVSSARSDLKMLYSAVEGYFTGHGTIPDHAQSAVSDWQVRYRGRYTYTRHGFHDYEFRSTEKAGEAYLYIDENGEIGRAGEVSMD